MTFLAFVIGLVVGIVAFAIGVTLLIVGDLRVDQSDKDDRPYMFLELSDGGYKKVMTKKFVLMRVVIRDYLPRK